MVITRTPLRISFFGGGTDYPLWYREHGGAVLSTAIDKYCYISVRHLPPFFEHTHRIVYSKIENVKKVSDISHPAVRAVFETTNVEIGKEVHHDADLPARSGLGSSSSFAVGLINAIMALRGVYETKRSLACAALHVEQNVLKENVGSQDQVAAAYGGFNRIDFHNDDGFSVKPVDLETNRLNQFHQNLLLVFTGFSRFASGIAGSQLKNFNKRQKELSLILQMVKEGNSILEDKNRSLNDFGKLLHEGWNLKRALSSQVSNPQIDHIYTEGLKAGALGGKLLGAGGGGFMLFFAPPEVHSKIRERLKPLVMVPFNFDRQGSQVIFSSQSLQR